MNLEKSTTVKELIKILQSLPQDYPVLVSGYESGYEHFYYPQVCKVTHHPDNKYFEGEYQIADEKETGETSQAVILGRMVRDD